MHETVSLKIFRGMKSKNPNTISISSKSSMESQLNDIKFCNTSWYRNSISAFQKKKLKAIKKKPNHPPKNTTPPDPNKHLFFCTKLRKLEHFSENNQNPLAAVQCAAQPNYSLWLVPNRFDFCQGQFFIWTPEYWLYLFCCSISELQVNTRNAHADLPLRRWDEHLSSPESPQLETTQLEPLHCSVYVGTTHFVEQ